MLRHLKTGAAALTISLLTACGSAGVGGTNGVIEYWLWDSGQQPGYQKCADAFQQQNPGLRIRISQYGWDDYWSKLTAGFIADTAPDVFTDHLSKYAQFVDLKVLRPLDDLGPTADIQDGDYQEGLAELWKGQDGKRYGAPKDWDTIATFYDRGALKAAGVDPATLENLSWNPVDGGTFEKAVARGSWMISTFTKLTDASGKKLDIGIAPTPIGPTGKRASMFNGLADSITTLSKQPDDAAKWVRFLSGEECQNMIGESGVVVPARPKGTELAIAYNAEERDLDVTAFTDQVRDKTTFLFPVTTNAADILALMQPRLDAVYIGSSPVSSMTKLNDQLNDLFKVAQ